MIISEVRPLCPVPYVPVPYVPPTTAEDAAAFLGGETLGRFPQVGAFLSSAADQEAHEWDEYGHGVFTHEVLSGLRGAADVNGDGRIEYSELYAFLSSANREVKDPRARLKVNAKAPLLNGRSPLVIADQRKRGGWLRGKTGTTDRLRIEDERGARLLDLRPEKGFSLRLALPAGRRIFVTTQQGEAELRLADGETFGLSDHERGQRSLVQRWIPEAAPHSGLGIPRGATGLAAFPAAVGKSRGAALADLAGTGGLGEVAAPDQGAQLGDVGQAPVGLVAEHERLAEGLRLRPAQDIQPHRRLPEEPRGRVGPGGQLLGLRVVPTRALTHVGDAQIAAQAIGDDVAAVFVFVRQRASAGPERDPAPDHPGSNHIF